MAKTLQSDVSNNVSAVISQRFDRIKKQFSINLSNIFGKSYDRAVQVGIELGGNKPSKSAIKNKATAVSKMMSSDIDTIKNSQSQNVRRIIAQSYAQGLPSSKRKAQVSEEIGQSGYRLDRAIRTNTAYLGSLTKLMAWAEMGFTEYEWILGKDDSNTRPYHKKLHGKIFKIKAALEGRAPIPGRVSDKNGKVILSESINCRCGIRLHK